MTGDTILIYMAITLNTKGTTSQKDLNHLSTFSVGDSIVVDTKIQEGDKVRIQKFKGIVISISGRDENKTFTVRHIGPTGAGVERTWPIISPWIQKIVVEKSGDVRRAKLYYLRVRKGKSAKVVKGKVDYKTAEQTQ
jgi:large subunit ribosomal protein L19